MPPRTIGHGIRRLQLTPHRVFCCAPLGVIPSPEDRHECERFLYRTLPEIPVIRFDPPQLMKPWDVGLTLTGKERGRDIAALVVYLTMHDYIKVSVPRHRLGGLHQPRVRCGSARCSDDPLVTEIQSVLRRQSSAMTLYTFCERLGAYPRIPLEARREMARHRQSRNTPIINALAIQAEGFGQYLRTAESRRFSDDDLPDVYRRYLPWAVALDAVEEWNAAFSHIPGMIREIDYFNSTTHAVLSVAGPLLFRVAITALNIATAPAGVWS